MKDTKTLEISIHINDSQKTIINCTMNNKNFEKVFENINKKAFVSISDNSNKMMMIIIPTAKIDYIEVSRIEKE